MYKNTSNCYQTLVDGLICARVLGKIPIDAVRDEFAIVTSIELPIGWAGSQNPQSEWPEHGLFDVDIARVPGVRGISHQDAYRTRSFEEAIESAASKIAERAAYSVDISPRQLRPYYLQVWSEKTLPSKVESEISNYPVGRYVQGSGHSGWYHVNQFIQNVKQAETPGYLLYLTDWDSAGEAMPGGVASKIEYSKHQHGLNQPIKLDKLGLTEEQVREHELPQNFDKDEPYVELNALEAEMDVFCDIVRDALESLSIDTYSVQDKIDEEINRIESIVYRRAKAKLMEREDELREIYEEAGDLIAEFNEISKKRQQAYDAHVADYTTELTSLKNDGRLDEWYAALEDIPHEISYPRADVPYVEPADEPEDPLYDSTRTYIENSRRINEVSE